jgi:hypothetical protein
MSEKQNNKQIDGVKKQDKSELKRSRKIVLDTIGEGMPPPPPVKPAAKKMDGLVSKKPIAPPATEKPKPPPPPPPPPEIKKEPKKEKILSPKEKEERKKWRQTVEGVLSVSTKRKSEATPITEPGQAASAGSTLGKESDAADDFIHPKEKSPQVDSLKEKQVGIAKKADVIKTGEKKKKSFPPLEQRPAPKVKKPKIDKKQVKEQARKAKEKEKLDQAKERARKAKEQAQSERKEKAEKFRAQKEREKKRLEKAKVKRKMHEKRQRKLRAMRIKISDKRKSLIENFSRHLKRTVNITLVTILVSILLYAVIVIVVMESKTDNKIFRYISNIIPVPAYVTNQGIVEYYTYLDVKNKMSKDYNDQVELEKAVKVAVIEQAIVNELIQKHNLGSPHEDESDELIKLLSSRIVFDHEINQVGIKRIKKINQLIEDQGDFVKIANTYGDEQGQLTLTSINQAQYSFSDQIIDLAENEISKIIYAPESYYIFKNYRKPANSSELSFVFIQAKTLDEYLHETIENYRMWSWVD